MTIRCTFLFLLCLMGLFTACEPSSAPQDAEPDGPSTSATDDPRKEAPSVLPSKPVFREVARESGLVFDHFIGASGDFFLPEIMGPGVALFDYDNDGDLDVYVTQGIMLDPKVPASESTFAPKQSPGHRLYRNELVPTGELRFSDVTGTMGVTQNAYGMGVATGDIDDDGDTDLYVTQFGANQLYLNNGNGTFADATSTSGAQDSRWSTSAAFTDYDRDGDLDLYIVNYVDFTVAGHQRCIKATGEPDYCTPENHSPVTDTLLRNDGSGKFTDVSEAAGIRVAAGPGLGVTASDFNGDGWPDLYVANDMSANFLWLNQHDGTFVEAGLISGAALNEDGRVEASMGVSAGDFDSDGDDDLFMTHLNRQTNTLYVNNGRGAFIDQTDIFGLGAASIAATGFGTGWIDVDNDGDLDLFSANGGVMIERSQQGSSKFPYAQRNQLFVQDKRFTDISEWAGDAMALEEVSRAAAFGDIDNDGDIDIVVSNCNGPIRLLQNLIGQDHASLQIDLTGTNAHTDGVGAQIAIEFDDGTRLRRRVSTDGSYLSASSATAHFGLGGRGKPTHILVDWPGGKTETYNIPVNQNRITLHQGGGH